MNNSIHSILKRGLMDGNNVLIACSVNHLKYFG